MSERNNLLGVYLNDHLAGATGGLELFRRAAGSAHGANKAELQQLTEQIEQDRQSLLAIMGRLGIAVRHDKVVMGWVLEKVGRLKTNGHLFRRSALSDLVELEVLVLGVQGKAAGFRSLRSVADQDPRLDAGDLDELLLRAEKQAQILERLRGRAAARAFAGPDPASAAEQSAAGR